MILTPGKLLMQFLPSAKDRINRSHIRHRTAGKRVWQKHFLLRTRQNHRCFRHKMDTTENNVFGFHLRADLAEGVRVALMVAESYNPPTLVVVSQDH